MILLFGDGRQYVHALMTSDQTAASQVSQEVGNTYFHFWFICGHPGDATKGRHRRTDELHSVILLVTPPCPSVNGLRPRFANHARGGRMLWPDRLPPDTFFPAP